ncbi:MAG: bacillithiol system redox-active protein YtxJ [Bacteroidota bacterium]
MNWKKLEAISQLAAIDEASRLHPVMIFKHSTRCSVSSTALDRLNRNAGDDLQPADHYYLDLIAHRDISNAIAERYGVIHESPQMLVIRNGKAVHVTSHMEITYTDLRQSLLEAV